MGVSTYQRFFLMGIISLIVIGSFALSRGSVDASNNENKPADQADTPTDTVVPPTATNTPLPPTPTSTIPSPTETNTPPPPTATATPLPPTPTSTSIPPTQTHTPAPPTATNTPLPTPTNQPPTISSISDRYTSEDTPTGFIPFTISDSQTAPENLFVSASSSNTILIPPSNIRLGGSGNNRTIKLVPKANKNGPTTITLTVSDGQATVQSTFNLKVRAVNDAPIVDLNGSGSGIDFSTKFVTNSSAVTIVDTDLHAHDIDNSNLVTATVSIANPLDGAAEILTAVTDGSQITAEYSSGILILTGPASRGDFQKVLRTIEYRNTSSIPNTSERFINFIVSDGNLSSSTATSTVSIIDPHLIIDKSPDSQIVPLGGSAIFTINLENNGNVPLYDVEVTDPNSPNCNRNIGTLEVGESRYFSCNQRDIQLEFTNIASGQGRDSLGNEAFHEDWARVEVENPNIQIVKSPSSQTKLVGESAIFDVYVINTSDFVDLVNVEVEDPLAPNCSRSGSHSFSNLPAGQDVLYQCHTSEVSVAFTNIITVTGTNLHTGQPVQDSSVARVELLDLSASLLANPSNLQAPGGSVDFTLTISNPGSIDFTLAALTSEKLGPLLDPDNTQVNRNECLSQPMSLLKTGEHYTCTFSSTINDVPPSTEVSILIEAHDSDNNIVRKRIAVNVKLTVPNIHKIYLPLTTPFLDSPDEDNDLPCQAFEIGTNLSYKFIPDDRDDWYYFDIVNPGDIEVRLRDFLPEDGQLAVWKGTSCDNLTTLVSHNANYLPNKNVSFYANPDRYYVWISNFDNTAYDFPYSLYIDAP